MSSCSLPHSSILGTEEKKVAVPPGATKIEVRVTPFCNNGTATVTGPDGFTVDAVSVTPVP